MEIFDEWVDSRAEAFGWSVLEATAIKEKLRAASVSEISVRIIDDVFILVRQVYIK